MPGTYAILGATGNCGTALIDILLRSPDNRINAYCRNKAKFVRLLPAVAEDKRVRIFEGSIKDVDLMVDCLRGCQVIFLVASTNTNVPGCRVGQDCAEAILAALKKIKKEAVTPAKLPKIVVLSSATLDKHLSRKMSWWFGPIMHRAGAFVYEDLRLQEEILRAEQDWVTSIYIKPGGLSVDKQRGHKLDFDEEETFLSYLDLSAAMIEAADDADGLYDMKNVSVVNTGGSAKLPLGTPLCLFFGLIRYFLPWSHPYLPTPGP